MKTKTRKTLLQWAGKEARVMSLVKNGDGTYGVGLARHYFHYGAYGAERILDERFCIVRQTINEAGLTNIIAAIKPDAVSIEENVNNPDVRWFEDEIDALEPNCYVAQSAMNQLTPNLRKFVVNENED